MGGPGFAIIDFETTGLDPSWQHRVVEVAVVHADRDGRVTGVWDTLVNPGRDVGPTRIHGIRAVDVLDAPTFAQIAPRLVDLLAGRVLVAHNASFDTRFLIAELTRAGYQIAGRPQALCTMRLAGEYLPGSRRSLRDCCDAFDIDLDDAHRASADAMATAELLRQYIRMDPDAEYWHDLVDRAAQHDWPPLAVLDVDWVAREAAVAPQTHYLQRIAERLPHDSGPGEHAEYLSLLDRCLIDRTISRHESDQLVRLAEELGIDRAGVVALNRRYFDALVQIAWEDGVLTTGERADLATVAALLRVDPELFERATASPPLPETRIAVQAHRPLEPGDLVVLTGDMDRQRDEWEADLRAHGYVPWGAVTKRVRLVVAADPDSLSGKARKAREYGIPIIDERTLAELVRGAGPVTIG